LIDTAIVLPPGNPPKCRQGVVAPWAVRSLLGAKEEQLPESR
jgi:hypothetical protein